MLEGEIKLVGGTVMYEYPRGTRVTVDGSTLNLPAIGIVLVLYSPSRILVVVLNQSKNRSTFVCSKFTT